MEATRGREPMTAKEELDAQMAAARVRLRRYLALELRELMVARRALPVTGFASPPASVRRSRARRRRVGRRAGAPAGDDGGDDGGGGGGAGRGGAGVGAG